MRESFATNGAFDALTPCYGEMCCEAASFCFEQNGHPSPTKVVVSGSDRTQVHFRWASPAAQAAATYRDKEVAAENGAYAVAIALLNHLHGYRVVERSSRAPDSTILLRSAATLALRCHELERAERLAAHALVGLGPEGLKEEVRDVLEQVYFGRHMALRGIEIDENDLQVSLSGRSVSFGMIAANRYLDRAKLIGKRLRRTTERVLGVPFQRRRGRSKDLLPIFMSIPRAASFAVTYRLGSQGSLEGMDGPDAVLATLLDDIRAANNRDWDALRARISDEAYFANFLGLLRQIAPDGTNVSLVGFTLRNRGAVHEVPLVRERRELFVDRTAELSRDLEVVEGVLSGADRNKSVVRVGNERIRVPEGLIDDIVRPLWGATVRATVERRRGTTARVLKDVEILDT